MDCVRTAVRQGARSVKCLYRRVAAADYDDVLALGVQHARFEVGHLVAQPLAVRRGEIVECGCDAGQADAGGADVSRLVDAGREQHGVVAFTQLGQADIVADLAIEMEGHPGVAQQLLAPLHDVLLELEVRDAIDQQAADPVVAIEDRDLVALAPQLLGSGQPARTGADDRDPLLALAARLDRLHPALFPGGVGDELLD